MTQNILPHTLDQFTAFMKQEGKRLGRMHSQLFNGNDGCPPLFYFLEQHPAGKEYNKYTDDGWTYNFEKGTATLKDDESVWQMPEWMMEFYSVFHKFKYLTKLYKWVGDTTYDEGWGHNVSNGGSFQNVGWGIFNHMSFNDVIYIAQKIQEGISVRAYPSLVETKRMLPRDYPFKFIVPENTVRVIPIQMMRSYSAFSWRGESIEPIKPVYKGTEGYDLLDDSQSPLVRNYSFCRADEGVGARIECDYTGGIEKLLETLRSVLIEQLGVEGEYFKYTMWKDKGIAYVFLDPQLVADILHLQLSDYSSPKWDRKTTVREEDKLAFLEELMQAGGFRRPTNWYFWLESQDGTKTWFLDLNGVRRSDMHLYCYTKTNPDKYNTQTAYTFNGFVTEIIENALEKGMIPDGDVQMWANNPNWKGSPDLWSYERFNRPLQMMQPYSDNLFMVQEPGTNFVYWAFPYTRPYKGKSYPESEIEGVGRLSVNPVVIIPRADAEDCGGEYIVTQKGKQYIASPTEVPTFVSVRIEGSEDFFNLEEI